MKRGFTVYRETVAGDRSAPTTARLARWAKRSKVPKSDVIRALIDRAGPIDTGDELIEWIAESSGKGLGLAQKP